MADITTQNALTALKIVTAMNKLILKAFSLNNRNALIFFILNDTISMVLYDRAVLWDLDQKTPKLLGVSGQSSISATSSIAKQWQRLVQNIHNPREMRILTPDEFPKEKELWHEYLSSSYKPTVLWVPIEVEGKIRLGLWLERWEGTTWTKTEGELLTPLCQAYGLAWGKLQQSGFAFLKKRRLWSGIGLAIALLLFIIRIHLRIVAPCEVVPLDPFLVTAPLEDIIDHIVVKPGQPVKVDDSLVEYDKRVALQNLKIAEEQTRVAQQDLNRAKTLAFKDAKSLAEVAVLAAKLKKEEANLDLAKFRASQLVIKAPENGIVMLDNPEHWRGKPVKVGEKILTIINPHKTKVRLWIPENDKISINLDTPIKVFLNTSPTVTRYAKLDFISNASIATEKNVVSFMAEGQWISPQKDVQVGLKGTAVLYGERVSLFYWIMRKPWAKFREFTGF